MLPSHTITIKQGGDSNGGELAELTSTEISLDLQGLIDDANFNDDNLFGDLGDAKKNELNNVYAQTPNGQQGVTHNAHGHGHAGHHNGARDVFNCRLSYNENISCPSSGWYTENKK